MNLEQSIRHIMADYGRPFYLYRQDLMERQAEILRSSFTEFDFLYSLKTNPFPPVIRLAASKGFGADAASAAEVDLALAAGIGPEDIFYSAPGKTRAELERSIDKARIIADSLNELELLNGLAEGRERPLPVGLRLNPDFALGGGPGLSNKFGVDLEQVYERRDWLAGLGNLRLAGLHVHLRSQVLDGPALADYYAGVFQMTLALKRELGWRPDYLNFGGGLGIVYSRHDRPLDIPALSGTCRKLWAEYKNEFQARLLIETGRFLVGEAGSYYTPVVDIKASRGRKYLLVLNALNGFLRPSVAGLMAGCGLSPSASYSAEPLYTGPDAFELSIVGKEDDSVREEVDVVGQLCTATDVLGQAVSLPAAEIGDIVRVTMAGSYAYSLSPHLFSSHQPPMQIFMDGRGNLISG